MNRPRVLNTRPREQAAELSRLLQAAGFEPLEAPAIAIVPAWSSENLTLVRNQLRSGSYTWVVLASANAGRGLEEHLDNVHVVCGAATARALGLGRAETLDRFSAEAALAVMRPHVRAGDRILVPRAAAGRDELIDGLRALGALVDDPVAYRTVGVADAAQCLSHGGIDIVALCSPSAVSSVASQALAPEVRVACIGETTATAARAAGLRVDAIAADTSMAALVRAIEALAGARV